MNTLVKWVKIDQYVAKFADCFSVKLALKSSVKFLWNWPIFLQVCLWKSCKIWLFFRNLSEALYSEAFNQGAYKKQLTEVALLM